MDIANEPPDLSPDEERLLGRLVEYEQALADGTPIPVEKSESPAAGGDLEDQLARGKHLLELMAAIGQEHDEEILPRPGDGAAQPTDRLEDVLLALQRQCKAPQHLGRFLIQRELGVGGHGVVLMAFDPVLKRQVALKVPRSEALISSALRRRFLLEARAAARLTHPNLVSVYEVGEIGNVGYIASAFCSGPSLAQWLHERREPLAPRQAAQLIVQLAEATQYAHSQGILHRDIKPSNVLLDADGGPTFGGESSSDALPFVPKLGDFGLAKFEDTTSSETVTGVAIGTPGYMAPEQVEGRTTDIGPATDVYGLGAVLYEALTGQRPFSGTSNADCMQRVLTEEALAPSRMRPAISADLDAICLKCLEKQVSRRYPSAQALANDLRRFLAGEPIQARRITRAERLARWARRNPRIAALTAAVLLLLTTIAVVSTVAAVRLDRARVREQQLAAEAKYEALRAAGFAAQARSESDTTRGVANFLEGMFRSADPVGLEGIRFQSRVDQAADLTAVDILRQGAESLRGELKDQPAVQAKLMAVIGSVYVTMGMLREAEPLLEESLRIREQLSGPDSLETAESLHDLASLRFANFDFSATRQLLERALAIRLRLLGPDNPDTIRTKFNLAWMAVTSGHSSAEEKLSAVPLMEEVVRFHQREHAYPMRYGFALIGLAMLRYEAEGKPMHAAALLAEANRVLSENGDSDIGAGLLLMLRSYVQARVGSGRVALATIESAINRIRKAAGDRHPVLIWPHYTWADALISTGRNDEALAVYRDTLNLCQAIYGERHRAIGLTKVRMAEPLLELGEVAEAEAVLREALEIFRYENSNLTNREFCLQDLLNLLYADHRPEEAVRLCREELALCRAKPDGKESPGHEIAILRKTALAEEIAGHLSAAFENRVEAIEKMTELRGATDSTIADMLLDQARVALALGSQEAYQTICRRLVATFSPSASPDFLRVIAWTCAIAPNSGIAPAELVEMAQRALVGNSKKIAFQRTLALTLLRAGQYQQALQQFEELLGTPGWTAGSADYALLAIAHGHLRDLAAAQQWQQRAETEPLPAEAETVAAWKGVQQERLERELLLSEASKLLGQNAETQ
jgi:tetratricopeptide (TPR) repeat protein/tRNA A-37 threonylcarbamoyl transferase component Bud32